jgi:hypothetical protein
MTRLSEFSPFDKLFTFGHFLITEAQIFWLLFPHKIFFLTKVGFGLQFG